MSITIFCAHFGMQEYLYKKQRGEASDKPQYFFNFLKPYFYEKPI
jgi:hypothetical protein